MNHCTVLHVLTAVMLVPSLTAANLNTQTQGLVLCSCSTKDDKIICVLANHFNTHTTIVYAWLETTGKHLCGLLSLATVTWASVTITQYGKIVSEVARQECRHEGIYYDYIFIFT
jgi:hypothetical protein